MQKLARRLLVIASPRALALAVVLACVAVTALPVRAQAPAAEQPLEDMVSVDFRDVPLSQVINTMIYRRNVNILTPPDLTQRVTVKLEAVPWKTALQIILANFGYGFEEIDGIIRVDLLANLNKTPITRNYEVRFLDSDGVTRFLAPLLSTPASGRLVEVPSKPGTPAKRVFIVTDVPGVHTRIEETLREFDRPIQENARDVTGPAPDGTMAVTFEGTPLSDAIGAIAARLRLSVAWEVRPTGTVDLAVTSLDLEHILDLLLLPRNLAYEYDDRLIRIGPVATFRPRMTTRTFTLKYANALELQRLIRSRMTPQGRLEFLISTYASQAPVGGTGAATTAAATPGQTAGQSTSTSTFSGGASGTQGTQTTNQTAGAGAGASIAGQGAAAGAPTIARSFVVSDTLQVLRDIEKIVKLADVLPSQVLIDVQLMELSLTREDRLGIRWNLEATGTGATTPVPFPFNRPPGNVPTPGFPAPSPVVNNTFSFGVVSFANFQYIVNALAAKNKLRTLSKPSVVTLDRQEANILVGEKFPVINETFDQFGRRTVTAGTFEQIGIQLRVVPQIFDRNHINMSIRPNVSQRGELIEGRFPVIQTREVVTQLMVAQGETAVIGGLMQDREDRRRAGIPGVMNLGVVGYLFGRRDQSRSKAELMIFVTPRILTYSAASTTRAGFPNDRAQN
jgi:type II secretory pathway component GspD/PulD (secretin)